jgi:DNA-directed RNA polymerase subunit RPC12/RpoP
VYRDAHLHAQADREYVLDDRSVSGSPCTERTYSLPDDERARLKAIAHTRDLSQLRQELDRVFLGWIPTPDILPAYQEAAQAWIGNGIVALRNGGRAALSDYTETIDEWIQKYRRRGGQQHVRHFVNAFSYECKIAFYLCYTSAWVAILDHLVHNQLTDLTGMRLMSMWHNQNRADVDEQGRPNDVFRGQVLALHPLSGIVQTSSDHLSVLGKWLNHPGYDELAATGRVGECSEYWDVVTTILIAAHEYLASHKQWDLTRGKKAVTSTNALAGKSRNDSTASAALFFEDFASERGINCPACSSRYRFNKFEIVDTDGYTVDAHYVCSHCGRPHNFTITYNEPTRDSEV